MNNEIPFAEYSNIAGLNIKGDPITDLEQREMPIIENFDINDNKSLSRRQGFFKVYSGTPHSLCPFRNDIALFGEGTLLKYLTKAQIDNAVATHTVISSATPLKTGLSGHRISYVDVNGDIYYTETTKIGKVSGLKHIDLPIPTELFKISMPAGEFIEYFNGSLFTTIGGKITKSDSLAFHRSDPRHNIKKVTGAVKLFSAVKDGIFLSFSGKTYFASGMDFMTSQLTKLADYEAIPHSAFKVPSEKIGGEGQMTGYVVIWASTEGICRGTDGGGFTNLTHRQIGFTGNQASALYRINTRNVSQYVVSIFN